MRVNKITRKRITSFTLIFSCLLHILLDIPAYTGQVATFYDDQDKVYLTIDVEAGDVFPALAFEDNRAFMGWAKRKGLSKGAKWQEGQSIPAKDAVYYPAITSKPKESTADKLVEPHNHSYVYLVGDSRMKFTQDQFGKRLKRTRFIAKCGQGLPWLSHQGYQELLMAIRSDGATVKKQSSCFLSWRK